MEKHTEYMHRVQIGGVTHAMVRPSVLGSRWVNRRSPTSVKRKPRVGGCRA